MRVSFKPARGWVMVHLLVHTPCRLAPYDRRMIVPLATMDFLRPVRKRRRVVVFSADTSCWATERQTLAYS